MRFPEFAVIDVVDAFPNFRFGSVLLPAGSEMAIVKTRHLRREPRRHMHAVRNMADRHAIFVFARVQAAPHRARYFAMQRRHRVRAASDA